MNPVTKLDPVRRLSRRLALAALLVAAGPLAAHETDPAYTMTVIIDSAYGGKVTAGKYERAIEKITARENSRDPFSRETNLCVAYTKTGELDKATEACEAALAIMLAGDMPRRSYRGTAHSGKSDRVYLALALSNLGVLQAAKGSTDSARKTFREAVELGTGLSAPRINLDRLARKVAPRA